MFEQEPAERAFEILAGLLATQAVRALEGDEEAFARTPEHLNIRLASSRSCNGPIGGHLRSP